MNRCRRNPGLSFTPIRRVIHLFAEWTTCCLRCSSRSRFTDAIFEAGPRTSGREMEVRNLSTEVAMRNVIVAAVLTVLGASVSTSAADTVNAGFFGKWKMNTAKSTADPGPLVKSQTVTIEPHGDGFTLTTDAEDATGAKSHTTRTASLDGKEVIVDSNSPNVKEAYTRINDRAFQRVLNVNGQVRNTLKATLSGDGKTFTIDATGTNADGKRMHNTVVFDKE